MGRLSRRRHRRSIFTPYSLLCAYQIAPGRSAWPSRDPIEEKGGINLYGMVGNNLVSLIDVLGHAPGNGDPIFSEQDIKDEAKKLNDQYKDECCFSFVSGNELKSVSLKGSPSGATVTMTLNSTLIGNASILKIYWWDCVTAQSYSSNPTANRDWYSNSYYLGGTSKVDNHTGKYPPTPTIWNLNPDPYDSAHWDWRAYVIYKACVNGKSKVGYAVTSDFLWAWGVRGGSPSWIGPTKVPNL